MALTSNWFHSYHGNVKDYLVHIRPTGGLVPKPDAEPDVVVTLWLERQDTRRCWIRLDVEEARELLTGIETALRQHGVLPRLTRGERRTQ